MHAFLPMEMRGTSFALGRATPARVMRFSVQMFEGIYQKFEGGLRVQKKDVNIFDTARSIFQFQHK